MDKMELLIQIFAYGSWGVLCYMVGRMLKVNKALDKQWPQRHEFLRWQQEQLDQEKNITLESNNYEHGKR